jgi:DNA topoisomerase VI subunit B
VAKSDKEIVREFKEAVNMSAKELESWLKTKESEEVGQKDGGSESKGHESGRLIVKLLDKKESEYDEDDISQIKRVVSYIHRHSAQRPSGDIEDTHWRYSLMNWGHDPLKE